VKTEKAFYFLPAGEHHGYDENSRQDHQVDLDRFWECRLFKSQPGIVVAFLELYPMPFFSSAREST
jgi:hypothetical protein